MAPRRKRIPLCRCDGTIRTYVWVDAADYEWLMQWRWCLTSGYAVRKAMRSGERRTVYMHCEILGLQFGDSRQGDHINLKRLDNRRQNLRVATRAEMDNGQNVPSRGGSSKYRGVSWCKYHQKWQAYAKINYKKYHLGYYVDEEKANAVVVAFRAEHMHFSDDYTRRVAHA
jgi:hypothetical protein